MADPAKIEAALARIEAGDSERAACEAAGINRGTFRSAVLRFGMADQYARATEALARDQIEKLESTLDELRSGDVTSDVAKIEIDARKWLASKLFKPSWGDHHQVQHSGGFRMYTDPLDETA
jgi:hypothetical protein